ncbi:MAG: winged helix-turn-helix domain-containing protein [Nitrosarchaeum sp.]|nr:winged helix-turn-helix domain-containing protein [Nitrosarchaeum sp.]
MEIQLDERDRIILEILLKDIKGVGYNELLRRTKFNKKPLSNHLKKLEENEVISKEKLGDLRNSSVIYKAKLSPDLEQYATQSFMMFSNMIGNDYNYENLKKIPFIASTSHMVHGMIMDYYFWVMEYMIGKISRVEFQFVTQTLQKFIDDWKKMIHKKLPEKDRFRLLKEADVIKLNEIDRINWMASDSVEIEKLRTAGELKLFSDMIVPIRVYWSQPGIQNKKRSELVQSEDKKKEISNLENEYIKKLEEVMILQRKLIGRFPDHKMSEHIPEIY